MAEIDYYFTLVSPWAYLGHRALVDLAARTGSSLRYRPVMLAKVFENSGAVPLAQRTEARQEYRFLELQRWRTARRMELNLRPKHFPTNPALADKSVIALVAAGHDPADYMERVFRACWVEDRDIADPEVLRQALADCGHDGAILEAAGGQEAQATYEANTAEAVRINAIGSPTYVLNGEVFWGQDRLEMLVEALETGRAPYRVPG